MTSLTLVVPAVVWFRARRVLLSRRRCCLVVVVVAVAAAAVVGLAVLLLLAVLWLLAAVSVVVLCRIPTMTLILLRLQLGLLRWLLARLLRCNLPWFHWG